MIYWFVGVLVAALLLVIVAPRPAWIALAIAGLGAFAAREVVPVTVAPLWFLCPDGASACSATFVSWYSVDEDHAPTALTWFLLDWPSAPASPVVAGVLVWAIRRRSWRTAVAGALYGAVLWPMPHEAPIVLCAAAAAAAGPRKDPHYLAGIGVLLLMLLNPYEAWTLLITIITIAVTLTLGIWAAAKKNGVNAAVALVSLAVAPLTPFLSAGVLLTTAVIRRTAARSAGRPNPQPAR